MSFRSGFLHVYVSGRTLLYKVAINVYIYVPLPARPEGLVIVLTGFIPQAQCPGIS